MKKRHYIISVLFCVVFFYSFNTIYGGEKIVSEILCNATEYTVKFKNAKAMISRDGSQAIPITSGTKLTKPGTYFLTLLDDKKIIKINTFTIVHQKVGNRWEVNLESELEEILKYALEGFEKEITIQFNNGPLTLSQLKHIFDKQIDGLLKRYPKLVYEGYTSVIMLGNKPTVHLKFSYPLKVTNTLKTYDLKTSRKVIQIINENIVSDMEDYQREIKLFKYIIDNITYSKITSHNRAAVNATPMSHTMYGGLIDQSAVCDGYSKSLMYLLNAVGVPTNLMVGHTSGGVLHAWNLVQIQGDYYHVDATWADREEHQLGILYEYFNEKDSIMKSTHTWDTKFYPKAISETYTMAHLPLDIINVYRIKNIADMRDVLESLAKDPPLKATVVLYEDALNKWNQDKVLHDIVSSLRNNITYSVARKYNCLIISFNKA